MAEIAPCVTASTSEEYRSQIERIASFAKRIHVDVMDGVFAPVKSITPIQAWWPSGIVADIHIMFQQPITELETLISLEPHMVIVHAEAEGDLVRMLQHLQKLHIKAGVALLKETTPESARQLIAVADHALLFSGDLGRFGGSADLAVLDKIPAIQQINPTIEIGWDGGASIANAPALVAAGVTVINVGGAIQKASNPQKTYEEFCTVSS